MYFPYPLIMIFEQTVTIPESHRLHLDLELPNTMPSGEAFLKLIPVPPATMLLSEASLAKTWDLPEEDTAWEDL
jgi:hypothetical protein